MTALTEIQSDQINKKTILFDYFSVFLDPIGFACLCQACINGWVIVLQVISDDVLELFIFRGGSGGLMKQYCCLGVEVPCYSGSFT